MPDKGTSGKVIKVGDGVTSPASAGNEIPTSIASNEMKSKATSFRIFAVLSWIVAIGVEIVAIVLLRKPPINMIWFIVLIVVDLIFAVIGSVLWKKANSFDPASVQDKVRFFFQNQLGAIISIIAFLPLVILIFTNKDMDGKQKGIIGSIAVVALLVAGITGVNFNPPSQEQNAAQTPQVQSQTALGDNSTQTGQVQPQTALGDNSTQTGQVQSQTAPLQSQTAQVQSLTGGNNVFWTKSGTVYHLYSDCSYISGKTDIFQGTVAQAQLDHITRLCDRCAARAEKEKGLKGP